MKRWLLTCTKTGRFWTYASEGQARRAALTLGLKNYQLEEVTRP